MCGNPWQFNGETCKKLPNEKDSIITVQRSHEATVNYMKHYIQPTINRKQPEKIVIHVVTNELSTGTIHLVRMQNYPKS